MQKYSVLMSLYKKENPEYLDLAEARIAAVREAVGSKVDIILENHCYTDAQSAVQFGNMAKEYGILYY